MSAVVDESVLVAALSDSGAEGTWAEPILASVVTSCDAWYVAVAEELDLPLGTLDRALAAARGPRCRFPLPPVP